MKTVKAFAPATVANVSCGFDVLGFAVEEPGDEVSVSLNDSAEVTIEIIGDGGCLPTDPAKNTATVAVHALLRVLNKKHGVAVELRKILPLGSGMGSSAASAVAALVAVNHLLGEPFSRKELLPFAMEAERVACGSAHADNVAPSLLGGFVLIRSYDPLDIIDIPVPSDLFCTLVHPGLELKTQDSRLVLRQQIPLRDAVTQWGNIAGLITGLMKPDYDLIGRSLTDVVAEPARSVLIPGFSEVKQKAIECGALGAGISGSGPTIFALSTGKQIATRVGEVVKQIFAKYGLKSEVYLSKVNTQGARIISSL
ncbi:MAG TPA: homoserine kinase [Chryseosolibacter sp.]|nr:homoserine kinase [Chryseosolibacter sp.]